MKRSVQRSLIVICSISVVFATIVMLALQPSVQLVLFQRILDGFVPEESGSVQIDSFHLTRSGELVFSGLIVRDGNREPLMEVGRGQLRVDLRSLWKRELHVSTARLEEVVLTVRETMLDDLPIEAKAGTGDPREQRSRQVTATDVSAPDLVVRHVSGGEVAAEYPPLAIEGAFQLQTAPLTVDRADLSVAGMDSEILAGGSYHDENGKPSIEFSLSGTVGKDTLATLVERSLLPDHELVPRESVQMTLEAHGGSNELEIDRLELLVGSGAGLIARARVSGFTAGTPPELHADIVRGWMERDAAKTLGVYRYLPESFLFPDAVEVTGDLSLSTRAAGTNLTATTDHGTASLSGRFNPRDRSVNGFLTLDSFRPHRFGFPLDDAAVSATVSFQGNATGTRTGELSLLFETIAVRGESRNHEVADLAVSAVFDGETTELSFDAPFLRAEFFSSMPPTEIRERIRYHVERYIFRRDGISPARPSGVVRLELAISQPLTILVPLIPGLRELSPVSISLSYGEQADEMFARAVVDRLVYGQVTVEKGRFSFLTGRSALQYSLYAESVLFGDRPVSGLSVNGEARGDEMSAHFGLEEGVGTQPVRFGVGIRATVTGWTARMLGDAPDISATAPRNADVRSVNRIEFHVDGFDLERDLPPMFNIPGGIAGVVDAGGVLVLESGRQSVRLDISGREVRVGDYRIGSVDLVVTVDEDGRSAVHGTVRHEENRILLEGNYRIDRGTFELVTILERLEIDYLAAFIPEALEDARGHITGMIIVRGEVFDPYVSGEILFHEAGFSVSRLGSEFTIGNERVSIEQNKIRFSSLSLHDDHGGELILEGGVHLDLLPGAADTVRFDVVLQARRFNVLRTTAADDDEFHGTVNVDSDVRVSGTSSAPIVRGSVGLTGSSRVTFVLPDSGTVAGDAYRIVRFEDRAVPPEDPNSETRAVFRGLDLSITIAVDRNTTLELVVDQRSGDRVRTQGGGDLSLVIDRGGTISLSGRYTISGGSYILSFFNVTRREFGIAPDSTITWTGDPFGARLDVRAHYTVRTSPAPLLSMVGPRSGSRTATGDLPFQVVITMRGTLAEPVVAFMLDMPAGQRNALGGEPHAAISFINQEESRRNTQAFALIILNQFVVDDLSRLDEAAVVAAGARSSAGQILTHQLNALSSRYIPGIDLSFTVDSWEAATDAGPEGRTEVQVELSQRLFEDRLIVRFGGQVELEGERRDQSEWADVAGDISVEYVLTDDGRYRLRAFRERGYQSPLDGTRTTTGVSLLFSWDFDRFPFETEAREDD